MSPMSDRDRLWLTGALRAALGLSVAATLLCALAPAAASAAIAPELVSKADSGVAGNGPSINAHVSDDGRYVVFESVATGLDPRAIDANAASDIFIRDTRNGTTRLVSSPDGGLHSASGGSYTPAISGDGRTVVFVSDGIVPGAWGVFMWDTATRVVTRLDVGPLGAASNGRASKYVSIDADGSRIAFVSSASNIDASVANDRPNVFVWERTSGTTGTSRLVSVSAQDPSQAGDSLCLEPSISADGRRVAFASDARNLVSGDTNMKRDVFVRDLTARTTTRISRGAAGEADGASEWPAISADGRYVAFQSVASNLVATRADRQQVYVGSVDATLTACVSVDQAGAPGNGTAAAPGISADGRYVSFECEATDLAAGSPAGGVFVRDRTAKATLRITPGLYAGAALASYTSLSADGRYLAFESSLSSPGTPPGVRNVYRIDRFPQVPAYLPAPALSTNYPARNHYFYVSGKVSSHTAATSIRLYFSYKADHTVVYKAYKTVTVKVAARATTYKIKIRFTSRGNYYVKARLAADTQHLDTTSPASRGFRVH